MYTLRINKRAKGMRISVYPDGRVVVTVRSRWYAPLAERFVKGKQAWIEERLRRFALHPKPVVPKRSRAEMMRLKREALALVTSRLKHFNQAYGFTYHKVTIRNQKTRWGSCSRKGNINFNYKLVLLVPELADYVVVHELCHLGAFNHSAAFWKLVAQTLPEHREYRARLKKSGLAL